MPGPIELEHLDTYTYQIPRSHRADMRVPARFYADPELLEGLLQDRSLAQLINTATLPGAVGYALAMPDIHQGYGFPIGGVVATAAPEGIISPGGVGYDINCGVRLLGSHLSRDEIQPHLDRLASALQARCPSGVGKGGDIRLKKGELEEVLAQGSRWALRRGYATAADLDHTEEGGRLSGADPARISERALERGRGQIGTLGAGNHFIEVDAVDAIFEPDTAQRLGLRENGLVVQIHCGSRGLGHQVCSDYVKRFQKSLSRFGYHLPDRELVCAPLDSAEGLDYLAAMNAAANFAFANRQVLTHLIRQCFETALAGRLRRFELFQIYDIAHNMAKLETHTVEGRERLLCVHRKGATRAFGPGRPEVPEAYRAVGQPVLVPGSMGTASWVLTGTATAMQETFGSTCHGAGRQMSRSLAKKRHRGPGVREALERMGIAVRAGSMAGLAEEAPQAYKDVDRVVEVVHGAGLARKVARLVPVAVVKG